MSKFSDYLKEATDYYKKELESLKPIDGVVSVKFWCEGKSTKTLNINAESAKDICDFIKGIVK
jgi:hypothetical protein